MNHKAKHSDQTSLYLRLAVGGYLVYLAWDLRAAVRESIVILIAVVVFGIVGAVVAGSSLFSLLRSSFRKDPDDEGDKNRDFEKESQ